VVADTEAGGGKRLTAYIVADPDTQPSNSELRDFLKTRLPEYMVPAFFMVLDSLPLTPNGKIDREALPKAIPRNIEAPDLLLPENAIELGLVRIWENVLNVKPIGVSDNFFDLGGHSLLAVRLMSEIEKQFGQRIPLVSLFHGATIEYLAGILRKNVSSIAWPTLVEIQPQGSKPPLFCVSTPNVNALGYRSLARFLPPDQPIFGLQAQYPEDLDGEHSQAAVTELAANYLSAMREARPTGPYQLIGLCRGAHIAFEMARQLSAMGEQVALLGVLDTWVMENTYNRFLYVDYYYHRIRSQLRMGLKDQLAFFKLKASRARRVDRGKSLQPSRSPLQAYFPGKNFVPHAFNGCITVFRVKKQPFNRIRDEALGWAKLALAGVHIHTVPGKHDNILQEPHVRVLAEKLSGCLVEGPDRDQLGV